MNSSLKKGKNKNKLSKTLTYYDGSFFPKIDYYVSINRCTGK